MQKRNRVRSKAAGCLLLLCSYVSVQAQDIKEGALKNKIAQSAARIGIGVKSLQEGIVTKTYTDAGSGIEYVYLQQTISGIPVYNRFKTLAFRNDKLVYSSGEWLKNTGAAATDTAARITAVEAIRKAAAHLRLSVDKATLAALRTEIRNHRTAFLFEGAGIAKREIAVQLYWAPDSLQKLHLAWNVNIDVARSPDWWNVRIDAKDGAVVNKDNWTTYEAAHTGSRQKQDGLSRNASGKYAAPPNDVSSASYTVVPFPAESPDVTNFTTVTNPWEMTGATNNATTYGWHYDGSSTYNSTRGNNVYAYEDTAAKNAPGRSAASATALPQLSFPFTPNFSQSTYTLNNQNAAITNLFYWNNLMHDVMYQYGFTEAAGNFQQSNMGRGGTGNDPVKAEAQDGSGTNNANFATPDDGTSGRMQMYLWDAAQPPSFVVNQPSSLAGSYTAVESAFSPNNKLAEKGPVTDTIALYNTDTLGCTSSLPQNIRGKIALIYRGGCDFTVKVLNAQKAGAIAVLMVNNVATTPIVMGGYNDTITIPAIMISQSNGAAIANNVRNGITVTATITGSPLIDGDFDNGVICHEYGHGISHRLTGGNASCLNNAEKPDEGWSDYFGLMMTEDWAKTKLGDSAKSRSIGTYAVGQPRDSSGIRTYPYSTNMAVNPHTYANVSKNSGEVHYIGEVWCATLWDMTWGIIKQEGSINPNLYDANGSGGNNIALRLVIEGEKLQPCSPGFLDARNAILAADSILYNYRHKCTIWNAFARRGMGMSAVQGSSDKTTDQTAAFDLPVLKMITEYLPAVNDQLTTSVAVTCECQLPQSGYQLTDTIPAGFSVLSTSPQATVQGNKVVFDASAFTTLGQTNTYSVTLVPDATAGCAKDTVVYDDRDAHTGGGFSTTRTRGATNWVASAAQSYSPTHAWYAAEPETAADFALVSNTIVPDGLSVLSFRHRFATEAGYDGGMVEISTNNGTSFTNATPYFLYNGYNSSIYQFNPADTSYSSTAWPAFTGTPKDTGFIQSFINLSPFAGKSIKVRFRMYTDLGTTYEGWYVDDITVTNACGGVQYFTLTSPQSKVLGSARIINFNVDSNGVVQPAFGNVETDTAIGTTNVPMVVWTTVSEFGASNFIVERSTDSLHFTTVATIGVEGAGGNYAYIDNNAGAGTFYYRISMTDASGNVLVVSPVRTITFTGSGAVTGNISVRPNPAVSSAQVMIDASLKATALAVYDMSGRRILVATLAAGATSYTINTGALSGGIYVVKVLTPGGEKQVKMMVRR